MRNLLLYLILFCSTNIASAFFVDNINYISIGNNNVMVVGGSFSSPTSVIIPSTVSDGTTTYTVTKINGGAFYYNSNLTSITLPSSVTIIEQSAFMGCSNLTSITIPYSTTSISIGGNAFQSCTSLSSLTFPNNVTSIGNYAFQYCSSLTSVTLPDSLTSIGMGTFQFSGLTSITIPSTVTSIGQGAFQFCSGLISVILPSGLTSIGSNVFQSCSGLTSITIPNGVTSIGYSTFNSCTSLTSIIIPASVTSILDIAFYNCTGLTSFTINAVTPPTILSNVFTNVTLGSVNLYVPSGSKTDYKSASVWSGFKFPPYITAPGSSTESTSSLSMNENSTAVTTFTADETVTWSLVSANDSALFSIDGSSGALVFTNAPDYETPLSQLNNNTYIVEVKATGTVSGLITTQQLTITVADVFETPAILSNFNSFTVSVGDSEFIINAPTSNSSGAITYTSSNPAVATFSGTSVYLVGTGTTTITATQAANGSYLGNSISSTMRVSALCGNWGYSLNYPISSPVTVGDSYGGGIVAYILQPGDPHYSSRVQHGLIASSANLSTATQWTSGEIPFSGATAVALGTGNQNTIDIVAGDATAGLAARLCYDLVEGGYSDWYLPSRDELSKLCLNRIAIGGFSQNWYWSSTKQPENEPQFPGKYAWYVNFYNNEAGGINYHFTTTTNAVRAVRSF